MALLDFDRPGVRSWQCPSFGSNKDRVLEWSRSQRDAGIAYNQSNPGFEQLEESIRILSGRPDKKLLDKQRDGRYSTLRTNRLKRNIREMVNSLSDIAFTPGFHSDSNDSQSQAELLNRVGYSWFINSFADLKIKEAIQWMAISPKAFIEIGFKRFPGKRGKSDIYLIARSFADVMVTGMPESGDLQEAYAVTVRKRTPIYRAHADWPEFQDKLIADSETPTGWIERLVEAKNAVFSTGERKEGARNPTVNIYFQYVLDLSINKSDTPKRMGYATDGSETSWSYIVPNLGGKVSAGYDSNSIPVFRTATTDDARMFPGRRLIIFTDDTLLYDGPQHDWHGRVPLVELGADSWPFGDFSMIHDVAPIHNTLNELQRMTHQTVRNAFNPSVKYNQRAVPRDKAKSIRPDMGGQKIGYNGEQGSTPIEPLLPDSFYEVKAQTFELMKMLEAEMQTELGVGDFSALAQMKGAANSDTMEKLLELAGPIVKGIGRDMERAIRDLWDIWKYLVIQYYDVPRVMQIVGVDGVTPESFDFDPGNLIPSHLPAEDRNQPSKLTRRERALWYADHVNFMVQPNTLHTIQQTSRKLMVLQLQRSGFPIDSWTVADVLGLPQFGKRPEGTNDIRSRYMWEQEDKAKRGVEMQVQAAKAMQEASGAIDLDSLAKQLASTIENPAQGLGPRGGFLGHSGRAPTAQTAPKIAAKGDGRVYVRESN